MRAEGGFDFDSALASLADKWVHLRCFSSPKQLHLLFASGFFAKGSQCCVTRVLSHIDIVAASVRAPCSVYKTSGC